MALAVDFSSDELALARQRVRHFSIEWLGETPLRLHSRQLDEGGAPKLSGEFQSYLEESLADRGQRRPLATPRSRVAKAFRELKRKAHREYYVLYGMCVIDQVGRDVRHGDDETLASQFEASLRRNTRRLNGSIRKGPVPEPTLGESEVLILVVSGLRKLSLWSG